MARRARRGFLAVAVLLVCAALTAPAALAGPTFSVMNAEGGIYWRSAPDWNAAERINGFGVYNGEIIEPHCYQAGAGNVPGTSDYMWEYASDVTGPGYGTGWLNEHFINDGQPINQPSPGVPPCNPPPPPAPNASTGSATETSQTATTLNATVNPNGGNVTDCHFEYGPNATYGSTVGCTPAPGSGGSPVAVSASVGALVANTTYHFRVVATNSGGTGYGADAAFATEPERPTVTTELATATTQTGARLNATVNPNGGLTTGCTIEYGTTSVYGEAAPCSPTPASGDEPVAVSATISALSPNTTYHYRVTATNAGGTSQGEDFTLTTLPEPPVAITGPATALSQNSATLTATVNPNGVSTECSFEYGPGTSYGSTAPCSSSPGAGSSPIAVSGEASGLQPSTTYHYRILAGNAGGSTAAADRQFTTLGPPDFGRCIKVEPETAGKKPSYHGGFSSAKCTSPNPAHEGKYEWQPGVARSGFAISLGKGTATLKTTAGTKITCHGADGTGSVQGTKEVAGVELTLRGCESLSHPCTTSGSAEGNIRIASLEGALGWQLRSAQTIGLDLYPPSHAGPVMSYRCVGSTESTITGSVIASISAAKMTTSQSLKLAATKGIQKPTHLEGEEQDVLIASLNGEASEQLGLSVSLTMSTEESVEINPST